MTPIVTREIFKMEILFQKIVDLLEIEKFLSTLKHGVSFFFFI